MTDQPEKARNLAAWQHVIEQARDLDPVIREALRPVFDRLKSDAPVTAPAFAIAMICRALRMIQTVDGKGLAEHRQAVVIAALQEVGAHPDHP